MSSLFPIASILQIEGESSKWYVTLQHPFQEPRQVRMTTYQLMSRKCFAKRFFGAMHKMPDLPKSNKEWERLLAAYLANVERANNRV